MSGKPLTGWRRLLRYRIAYKRIIPPEAHADPAIFPEEEFPIFCPKCNYLLRGLPDDRCPECGREFDRGRLLVEQYVLEYGKRRWRCVSKWAWRTWIAAVGLATFGELLVWFQVWAERRNPNVYLTTPTYFVSVFIAIVVASCMIALVLGLVSGWLFLRWTRASRRKRRQVFDAISLSAGPCSGSEGDEIARSPTDPGVSL
jgi:hypothetical protein